MKSTSSSGILGSFLSHVLHVGRGRSVLRAPGGPVDLDRHPAGGGSRVDQVKRGVRAGVGNSRVPWPTTTGQTNRVISSTSWLLSCQRIRAPLPCTCSSPPGLAFSSPTAAATSPERTVVPSHSGSVSVLDATYLGRAFNAAAMGLVLESA